MGDKWEAFFDTSKEQTRLPADTIFCVRSGPRGKGRSLQGLNPQRKMEEATHILEVISLESQQKCWHEHFAEKIRRTFLHRFP